MLNWRLACIFLKLIYNYYKYRSFTYLSANLNQNYPLKMVLLVKSIALNNNKIVKSSLSLQKSHISFRIIYNWYNSLLFVKQYIIIMIETGYYDQI